MDPVDEFLKEAGWWDTFKRGVNTMRSGVAHGAKQAVPGALVGVGMTAGASAVSRGVNMASERLTKSRDYKSMLEANPTLGKFDSGQVQMVYNSLRSHSPTMSKDPLIAGSFVRKTLEVQPESGPYIDPQTAKLLAETQRSLSQSRSGRGDIAEAFRPTQMMPLGPSPYREEFRRQQMHNKKMAE